MTTTSSSLPPPPSSFETPLRLTQPTSNPQGLNYATFAGEISRMLQLQPDVPGYQHAKNFYCLRKALQALVVSIHDGTNREVSVNEQCHLFVTLIAAFCGNQRFPTISASQEGDILTAFTLALLEVNPKRVPLFAFCYMRILGTPVLVPTLLRRTRGWTLLQRLISPLLSFLGSLSLYSTTDSKPFDLFSTALFRLLLVIIHDFPGFLCEYCSLFCSLLPYRCTQVRNLILSAFPSTQKLPDPTKTDIRQPVEQDWLTAPRILEDWSSRFFADDCFELLQSFYRDGDETRLGLIRQSLLLLPVSMKTLSPADHALTDTMVSEATKYDRGLIHAIVMDLVLHAPPDLVTCEWPTFEESITKYPPVQVILYLLDNLDHEGQELIVREICDQLRHPNPHTILACRLLYWLGSAAAPNPRREIIEGVVGERISVHRPHPWGLVVVQHLCSSSF